MILFWLNWKDRVIFRLKIEIKEKVIFEKWIDKNTKGVVIMSVIKVKNKRKNEVKSLESYDNWLDFHTDKSEYDIDFCVNEDCYGEAEVGVCVTEVGKQSREYVAPLCKKCNSHGHNVQIKVDEDYLVLI